MEKDEYLKYLIPAVIVLMTLAIFQQSRVTKRGKETFRVFYNAVIKGRIQEKVSASKGSSKFKVKGEEYSFHPYTSDLNDNSIFEYVAEPGDSIFKDQRQDTLFLIKSTKTLKYTFLKLGE